MVTVPASLLLIEKLFDPVTKAVPSVALVPVVLLRNLISDEEVPKIVIPVPPP
jgi:hypothetical protein